MLEHRGGGRSQQTDAMHQEENDPHFMFPSSLSPGQERQTPSMYHHMVSIKMTIDEIRQNQEEQELSMRHFIQEELQILRASLLPEIHNSKVSIRMGMEGIKKNQLLDDSLRDFISEELQTLKTSLLTQSKRSQEKPQAVQDVLSQDVLRQHVLRQEVLRQDDASTQTDEEHYNVDIDAPIATETHAKLATPTQDVIMHQKHAELAVKKHVEKKETNNIGHSSGICLNIANVEQWDDMQNEVDHWDPHCIYKNVVDRKMVARSFWHEFFKHMGYENILYLEMPQSCLAKATEHPIFVTLQTVLILSNTAIMGYESNAAIQAQLQDPRGQVPSWLEDCDFVFNIAFAAELLFRILALRSWFWVAPSEWGWNILDTFLVATALVTDVISGVNLSFMRTLRILRAVRVARIIRVLRFFRQLRQMLFAILACLGSLAWAFIFLWMVMFMFAILFLQGVVNALEDMEPSTGNSDADAPVRSSINQWYGSLGDTMFSLLAAVTGGADWTLVNAPLKHAGAIYQIAFVVYMLFVTVGVMNVLTGVFLSSADEFVDVSLIVQNEEMRVDQFCEQMIDLFKELDMNHNGSVDWPTFQRALRNDSVRAYLASLQIEPTHVRLIFDLLDEKHVGKIDVNDFVLGMVRLKGEAKAVDARIIQREIGMLPRIIHTMQQASNGIEHEDKECYV